MVASSSRREFLVIGGGVAGLATLGTGTLLAACGSDTVSAPTTTAAAVATTAPVVTTTAPVVATSATWVANNIAENLDPAIGMDSNSLMFIRNAYDGLYTYAPGSTEVLSTLAAGHEVSADGLVYTFSMKQGITFSDGAPFTAQDVAASYERVQAINAGPARYFSRMESFTAVDDETFEIRLGGPYSFLLGLLPWLPIVSTAAVDANKTADDPWAQTYFATNAAGTGPYVLEAREGQTKITMALRDDYWGDVGSKAPATLAMSKVVDPTTKLQLLDNNEAQLTGGGFGPTEFAGAATLQNVELVRQPGLTLRTMALNTQRTPTDDPVLREALVYLFDYAAYSDYYAGYGDPATGPLPPGFPGSRPSEEAYTQDIDRAAMLLEQGGYIDSGVELSFVAVQGADFGAFAGTLLQSALAEFGIALETKSLPWPQIPPIQADTQSAFHISFLNISANTPDPTDVLIKQYASANWGTDGGYNWAYYADPEFEVLMDRAQSASNSTDAVAAVVEAVDLVTAAYPTIYAISPQLVQPVHKDWTFAKYDALYNLQVTRPVHYDA
jgi:peptide/nickel transport system substrate-binding protein